jgi:glycosyltransferase involved in cell wall biosynthesis
MSNSSSPVVSIVTATRNRPALLKLALESIAQQTFADFEAIIVDDGSDQPFRAEYDAIWAGLDSRFKLHFARPAGMKGTGPSAARNFGIRQARGQFIAFLDDDDQWILPDHLAVGVAALNSHDADFYFANMQGMKRGALHTPDWYPNSPSLCAGKLLGDNPKLYEVSLPDLMKVLRHWFIHPNQAIMSRALIDEIGGFVDRIYASEDVNFTMRCVDRARRIVYRPDIAVSYRFAEENSHSTAVKTQDHMLQGILALQHLRLNCENAVVRRCARSREAWGLREMAEYTASMDRQADAWWFAWQSLATFPTLGAAYFLLKTSLRALVGKPKAKLEPLSKKV